MSVGDKAAVAAALFTALAAFAALWALVYGRRAAVAAENSDKTAKAALGLAEQGVQAAREANAISRSDPWAQFMMSHVASMLELLIEERDLFHSICLTHHKSAAEKKAEKDRWDSAKDRCYRNLHMIVSLAPAAAALQDARGKLDSINDSFFDRPDLEMPEEHAKRLLEQHADQYKRFVDALRAFAESLGHR